MCHDWLNDSGQFSLNNLPLDYIGNLEHLKTPNRLLRSSSKFQLQVPASNLKNYGHRAFSICAPKLWNCLPSYIRCIPNYHFHALCLAQEEQPGISFCDLASVLKLKGKKKCLGLGS